MQYHQREFECKPQPRRKSGKDNPRPTDPRHGPVTKSAKPTAATRYAVYSGRDRLGSYRIDGDAFEAYGRRGVLIGTFSSQSAAIDAIERGGHE
jgi:hypothetical protein